MINGSTAGAVSNQKRRRAHAGPRALSAVCRLARFLPRLPTGRAKYVNAPRAFVSPWHALSTCQSIWMASAFGKRGGQVWPGRPLGGELAYPPGQVKTRGWLPCRKQTICRPTASLKHLHILAHPERPAAHHFEVSIDLRHHISLCCGPYATTPAEIPSKGDTSSRSCTYTPTAASRRPGPSCSFHQECRLQGCGDEQEAKAEADVIHQRSVVA